MQWLIVVGLTFLSLALCDDEKYTDRYDDINIDEILGNKRLLDGYIKCILDKGRCTPEGKELKLHIKDAMQNSCGKCTDAQKKKARKVVKHIREHLNDKWEEIKHKYDPDNIYEDVYEAFLSEDDEKRR